MVNVPLAVSGTPASDWVVMLNSTGLATVCHASAVIVACRVV